MARLGESLYAKFGPSSWSQSLYLQPTQLPILLVVNLWISVMNLWISVIQLIVGLSFKFIVVAL